MAPTREQCQHDRYDAIVVGSGPNGLAAAVTLGRAGRSVLLVEAQSTIGGGCRSQELTLPGFLHDTCSAIHPLGIASPFFRSIDLAAHGLEWIFPPVQFAQPLDDGPAVLAIRSIDETAEGLDIDRNAYRRLMAPVVRNSEKILEQVLGPLRLPRHPLVTAAFGSVALLPISVLARVLFRGERACALLAGASAHSELPLTAPLTAGTGLLLGMLAHAAGWPIPRGGSKRITDALATELRALGGEIITDAQVRSLSDLPGCRDILFDVSPRNLLEIMGERLSGSYRRQLERFRYGPGAFKLDYALSGPIPWKDTQVARAGTIHLGGTFAEISASEAAISHGSHPERPYVLMAQQSMFDPTRAPSGSHTAWAYCHVPNGSDVDMTGRIEDQIERFAPGFRDLVLVRHVTTPAQFEQHNQNYVGGDINGGAMTLRQVYVRPAMRLNPYSTPIPGIYICSASTPPAGGVHGMCGYWAAKSALGERIFP